MLDLSLSQLLFQFKVMANTYGKQQMTIEMCRALSLTGNWIWFLDPGSLLSFPLLPSSLNLPPVLQFSFSFFGENNFFFLKECLWAVTVQACSWKTDYTIECMFALKLLAERETQHIIFKSSILYLVLHAEVILWGFHVGVPRKNYKTDSYSTRKIS